MCADCTSADIGFEAVVFAWKQCMQMRTSYPLFVAAKLSILMEIFLLHEKQTTLPHYLQFIFLINKIQKESLHTAHLFGTFLARAQGRFDIAVHSHVCFVVCCALEWKRALLNGVNLTGQVCTVWSSIAPHGSHRHAPVALNCPRRKVQTNTSSLARDQTRAWGRHNPVVWSNFIPRLTLCVLVHPQTCLDTLESRNCHLPFVWGHTLVLRLISTSRHAFIHLQPPSPSPWGIIV